MNCKRLAIEDVLLIEVPVFEDHRGAFSVTYNAREFSKAVGYDVEFVQDNLSGSHKNVVRGLHYQTVQPQGKLISVISGRVFDVAVDLRKNSPTYGKWVGEILSDENRRQLWIPKGFGHGFVVLSDYAYFSYKVTDYWSPTGEHCIVWNDEDLGIQWPIDEDPIISIKDMQGCSFKDAVSF